MRATVRLHVYTLLMRVIRLHQTMKWRLLLLLLVKKECSSFAWNPQGAVFYAHRSERLWFADCRHIFYFSKKKRHVKRKKQLAQIIKTCSTVYIETNVLCVICYLFTTHAPFILGIAVLFWAAAHHGLNSYPPLGKLSKWPWLYPPSTLHPTRTAHLPHPLPKRARLLGVYWHRTGWRLVGCTPRIHLQMV